MAIAAACPAAYADTAPQGDDMDRLLADKGLMTQINQVRHSMTDKASELVVNALGFLGVPYKRGGNTADTGFDCSGFVKAMYEQSVGLILPRRAEQQAAATQNIERSDLRPGDLVFFNTMRRAFSHVGIYVGNGKFIHSPKPGAEVRVESMSVSYWNGRFDGARRVASSGLEPNNAANLQHPAARLFKTQAPALTPASVQSQVAAEEALFSR
ncbi:MAG: peptidoglycan endopeptidase [Polaromonas sp.]|nr:peptidoglycan endopeptidase [Polaromonas sp.]